MRSIAVAAVALVAAVLAGPCGAAAEPVAVKLAEGVQRGFLVMRDASGKVIARGESLQKPLASGNIWSRLFLNFHDGTRYDEQLEFSQRRVFRVERYHMVQGGPSLPVADVSFDRATGRYRARTAEKPGGEVKMASGQLEMPADLYNGMTSTLLKNAPPDTRTSVHMVAFTPEPRLIRMVLDREGEDQVRVAGGPTMAAWRFIVKFELGAVAGAVAALIGKSPPDLRYWLVGGEIPAFVRFEGPMFLDGAVWQLDLTAAEFPATPRR